MLVTALTDPAFASIMKPLIDKGFINQDSNAIILIPLSVTGIFLIRAISGYINDTVSTSISATVVEKIRDKMFSNLLKLPTSFFDNSHSAKLSSKILFDASQITEAGFNVITVVVRDGFTIVGLICLLFYINWELTLFCIFTLPLVLLLVKYLATQLKKLSSSNQRYYGEMNEIMQEAIFGHKVVKLFNAYDKEGDKFRRIIQQIKINEIKRSAFSSLNSGVSQFLVACALSMILYFATTRSQHNGFTAGDFVSFITAMIMIFQPMKRITSVTQAIQRGLAAIDSVFSFLDEITEEYMQTDVTFTTPAHQNTIGSDTLNMLFNKVEGYRIDVSNIYFCYDYQMQIHTEHTVNQLTKHNSCALENVSFSVNSGELVALVGKSGSGKTTLANLIPRFYQATSGRILINGIDTNYLPLGELRSLISFVGQDVFLFNDTIFNNIAYSIDRNNTPNNIEQAVSNAAQLAYVDEFVNKMPNKFSTVIGENGARLSGGQKQRIAIARALARNAPILILDEATSALDNESEVIIQKALDNLMKNRTTIVIAHRLSTIRNADKIIVMDNGKIIEFGTHDELINNTKSHYFYLFNLNSLQ